MSRETEKYLKTIAERVKFYYGIRKQAVKYIFDNKITDNLLSVNIVLTAAIWAAHQRKEIINEDDLLIFFGLNKITDTNEDKITLELGPDQENLTLNELFEMTVENFK